MTERCTECGLFTGSEYKSDYYKLNDQVFCSLPCFNDNSRAIKTSETPKVHIKSKKVASGKQKRKRTTRKTKTRTKRNLSSKRR